MNKDFKEKRNFIDPLSGRKKEIIFSRKMPEKSIFDQPFLSQEREKSKNQPTVCFDLDGTIRGWDGIKFEGFLRKNLKPLLNHLKQDGYRLVIWSATTKDSLQQTINKYPEMEEYFDTFIAAEHFCFKFLSEDQKNLARKENPDYYQWLYDLTDEKGSKISNHSFRPPKNIKFLKYKILIDDDPNIVKEANHFKYDYIKLFTYAYKNPDIKKDFPKKLASELEENFKLNLVRLIETYMEKQHA